jgi:hypothetical protein
MPMKNPVHPRRMLREDDLAPLGLTVKAPPTCSARRARR